MDLFEKRISQLFEDTEQLAVKSENLSSPDQEKFITTLQLDQKEIGSFLFTRYRHAQNKKRTMVNNYSSIDAAFRNLGYGKILLLAAISTADHYRIIFEKDNSGVTPQQRSVYDWLVKSGYVKQQPPFFDMAGFEHQEWRLTSEGLAYLNQRVSSIDFL